MLFPYSSRPFQRESIEKIATAAEKGRNFLFQAPTGFGKTPVILAALLPLDKRILWITRTGNESNRPIEELDKINKKFNKDFLGLSFRGKMDMCPFAWGGKIKDYDAMIDFCEACPMEKGGLTINRALTFSEIIKIGQEKNMCPYKLQYNLAKSAKLISMSYNYVLTDLINFLNTMIKTEDTILVVDEAHNMQKAAGDLNSSKLTKFVIERAIFEARRFNDRRLFTLTASMRRLEHLLLQTKEEECINPDEILEKVGLSIDDMEYLLKYSLKVYHKQKEAGKPLRSFIRSFARFWITATQSKGKKGVIFLVSRDRFELLDMRVEEILIPLWERFSSTIFISGTLKPISSFSEIMGLREYGVMEVPSFASSVHPFIINGVTTRGVVLSELQKKRYNFLLGHFLRYEGNSAIFSASYRIQKEFIEKIREIAEFNDKTLFVERKGISGDEAHEILENFKANRSAVLIAPMGGRFAEGTDFPGSALEAIMLLGIPFERYSLKARLMIDYYTEKFGKKGRHHSYVVPAIRRASQALGRAIRSPQDFGLFILADERFNQYTELLPDYVERNLKRVHYSNAALLFQQFSNQSF